MSFIAPQNLLLSAGVIRAALENRHETFTPSTGVDVDARATEVYEVAESACRHEGPTVSFIR